MHDAELRAIFPAHLTRGALLRPDGVAVGLVCGGAPAWDLQAPDARAQLGRDYHRLLLALESPLDVFVVDQPPDLAREITELHARRDRAAHPLLADALDELADYLAELGRSSGSRAKQVIWAVSANGSAPRRAAPRGGFGGLLRGERQRAGPTSVGQAAMAQAVERARRLVDALRGLDGTPTARLMEAEEIARLVYALADPVRASRYPLAGTLLDRVRRVVTITER